MGGIVLSQSGGCSSPTNQTLMPIGLFPQAYAQALCGSLQHCCSENQITSSDADCTAGWRDAVAKLAADPVLASNYDSRAASDCVNRVTSAQGTSCATDPGSISDARDVCQRVFIGKKPLGATCTSSLECAPVADNIVGCEGLPIPDPSAGLLPLSRGVTGASSSPSFEPIGAHLQTLPAVRQCVAVVAAQSGSSCATPELKSICERAPDSYCDPTDTLCKARADVGGACAAGGCKVGLYCANGACNPAGDVDAPCTTNDQCNSFLRCDATAKKCAARLNAGDGCSADEECSIGVCDQATKRCLKNAIATSESCSGKDPTAARSP